MTADTGQAIVCKNASCCPATGTWTCVPLGSTCCKEANAVGLGMYCGAGSVCLDMENCISNDGDKTFPATTGAAGNPTASFSKAADKTVYGGSAPTTVATGPADKTVFGGEPTAVATAQGTPKPNGAAHLRGAGRNEIWSMVVVLGVLYTLGFAL